MHTTKTHDQTRVKKYAAKKGKSTSDIIPSLPYMMGMPLKEQYNVIIDYFGILFKFTS